MIVSVKALVLLAALPLWASMAPAQSGYDLRSPDKRIEIRIRTWSKARSL